MNVQVVHVAARLELLIIASVLGLELAIEFADVDVASATAVAAAAS